MTTAKLSFNFNLKRFFSNYLNVLYRHKGAGIFYGVLSFIFLPLQYILTILNHDPLSNGKLINEFFGYANCYNVVSAVWFSLLTLVTAVVLPVTMFSYLHNKRAIDVYHSLPYSREELLFSISAGGLTIMLLPMFINFSIMALISPLVPGASGSLIMADMFCWMLTTALTFMITVFAAVQVGAIFEAYTFSLVLNASFASLYMVYCAVCKIFLYGYPAFNEDNLNFAYKLSPISLIFGRFVTPTESFIQESNLAFVYWAVALIVITLLTVVMYKKRRSEKAGELGSRGLLSSYVRAVATLIGGLGLGGMILLIFNVSRGDKGLILFGVGASSLIVYFVGDVILSRTVKTFSKAVVPAIITSSLVCAFIGVMMTGGLGYENRIPSINEIESVSLGDYSGGLLELGKYKEKPDDYVYTSSEVIDIVVRAHANQVSNKAISDVDSEVASQDSDGYYTQRRYEPVEITYTLKSGVKVKRIYGFGVIPSKTYEILSELDSNDEFIKANNAIFRVDATDIYSVTHFNALGDVSTPLQLSATDKAKLLNAMEIDILNRSQKDIVNGNVLGKVAIELPDIRYAPTQSSTTVAIDLAQTDATSVSRTHLTVYYTDEFVETIAFLKNAGIDAAAQPSTDNINKLYLGSMSSYTDRYYGEHINDKMLYNINDEVKISQDRDSKYAWIKVYDKDTIDAIYANRVFGHNYEEPMAIVAVNSTSETANTITSYFYVPLSSLDVQMEKEFIEIIFLQNGRWALYENGIYPSKEELARLETLYEKVY